MKATKVVTTKAMLCGSMIALLEKKIQEARKKDPLLSAEGIKEIKAKALIEMKKKFVKIEIDEIGFFMRVYVNDPELAKQLKPTEEQKVFCR